MKEQLAENKKSILFVTQSLGYGGVEKALIELLKVFDANKFELTVLCMFPGGGLRDKIPEHCKIEIMPGMSNPGRFIWKCFKEQGVLTGLSKMKYVITFKMANSYKKKWEGLSKFIPIKEEEYDYAVAYHAPTDFPVIYAINNVKANKKLLWLHLSLNKNTGYDSTLLEYYSAYDEIVSVSKETEKTMLDKFPELSSKSRVIYNLLDVGAICEKASENCEMKKGKDATICTVGRLSPQKGYDIAIDSCKRLVDSGYDVMWYVCGEGNAREDLERLIKKNRIEKNFILLGNQSNPYKYIGMADIYCQTSKFEGYCITLAEARILKKPIVTTRFAGATEQIINNENGFIVETNAEAVANAIKALIDSPQIGRTFIKKLSFASNEDAIEGIKRLFGSSKEC